MYSKDDGMVDMKRTKAEKKARDSAKPSSLEDDYPYGHRVHLDHDDMEKLGMDMPQVGDKFHLRAHAHVASASEDSREGGKKHRRIELHLRKMAIEHGNKSETAKGERAAKGAKAAMDTALGETSAGGYEQGPSEDEAEE